MENYIRNKIKKHSEKFNIEFTEDNIKSILEETKKGIYAFQIIYNESDPEEHPTKFKYNFKLYKPLDVNKLKVWENAYGNIGNTIWSYDGGKTWKYGSSETLKFDLRIIRELKLNQIL
jgi:hypothetical protein